MASQHVQTFTDTNFDEAVVNALKPVLVDFWAEWCAPCRRIAPIIDELAHEFDGRLIVGKMNVDENQDVPTGRFHIMGIPTLMLFKGGQVVEQLVGVVGKDDLKRRIEKHL